MWRRTLLRCGSIPHNMTRQDPLCAQTLRHITPIVYSSLPNGFRVATEYMPDYPFATIGVWIDAGSRFETLSNSGVAHFLEHMNFKGTARYSKAALENLFEFHGAHFNAYTSRDRTAYYVKALNSHVECMIEAVADLLQHGRYAASELEQERYTILAEMREVESLVDEVIMDHLHQAAYDPSSSGLSLTILGPEDNIARGIDKAMIEDYVRTHYTGSRMCLVSSGGISPEAAHAMAERYFGQLPGVNNRPPLCGTYRGGVTHMCNESMSTCNTAVAFPICGATHPDSYALQLIHNVLGQVRDAAWHQFGHQRRNGNLPLDKVPNLIHMRPFYTPYEETALLGYQIVTERMTADPPTHTTAVDACHKTGAHGGLNRDDTDDGHGDLLPSSGLTQSSTDGSSSSSSSTRNGSSAVDTAQTTMLSYVLSSLYDLCETKVDERLLEQAKSEYKASVMMMRDSTTNSAEDLGRQMIHFGRRVPMTEVFERVDAVTAEGLRSTAERYLAAVQPVVSSIGARSTLPRCDAVMHSSLRLHPTLTANDFGAAMGERQNFPV